MAKKMLVFCGSDDPERAYPPMMLGAGAQAMDMELTLFFALRGLNIVKKGGAEKIFLDGAEKSVLELLEVVRAGGATLMAGAASLPIVKIEESELIDGIELGGVASFVDLAEESDVVLTF